MAKIIIAYLIIINLISFITFGIDKSKARRHAWRISEKALFLLAIFGGTIGCILGMQFFHHKTKHPRFVYGMPLILIIQIICLYVSLQLEIFHI